METGQDFKSHPKRQNYFCDENVIRSSIHIEEESLAYANGTLLISYYSNDFEFRE